jgi:NADH:ubiquinone oxidoreductase subunit E
MRLTPGYLTAVATFYDMFETRPKGRHDVYVCTNISCSLRGADALYEAMLSAAGDDPDFHVKSFECLGACDIAPMISVDGEYVGPLVPEDCAQLVDDVKAGRPVLEEKQLRHRKTAATPPPTPDRAASGPTAATDDRRGERSE